MINQQEKEKKTWEPKRLPCRAVVKLDYAKAGSQHKQKHHRHDQDSQGTSGPVLPCLKNKPHYSCTRLLEKKNPTKMGKAPPAFWK